MKHKILKNIVIYCLVAVLLLLCACDMGDGGEPGIYTIQYSDDTGIHSVSVESGSLYSINPVPTRNGYDFVGLFDSEVGGTQYVNSNGGSVSAFTDNKNLVLYPQFKAKEYTLILDYQGAAVTGSRSLSVSYGQTLSNLPTNLALDNKTFTGWYTAPERGGVQIADQYGVLPAKAKVTEANFDLSDPDGFINLYAGFKGEEHLVTFYIDGIAEPEEILVEHGTHISKVVTEARNSEGMAVLNWSKTSDKSEIFNGRIQDDMVLYSVDFAPVIDFDSNGGNDVNSVIAGAGSGIVLPTPVRENYTFGGWYTTSGKKFTATAMPQESTSLVARWNAQLIFDTNGGLAVENISEPTGTKITLPTTEKDGYMFAGWYTEQGQEYSTTSMPETSTKLFAKYYKTQSKRYVLLEATKSTLVENTYPKTSSDCCVLDLSELYGMGVRQVMITASYCGRWNWYEHVDSTQQYISMKWFNQGTASDGYKVWGYSDIFQKNDTDWHVCTHSTQLNLTASKYYVSYYATYYNVYNTERGYIYDFWVDVSYPDTSVLY